MRPALKMGWYRNSWVPVSSNANLQIRFKSIIIYEKKKETIPEKKHFRESLLSCVRLHCSEAVSPPRLNGWYMSKWIGIRLWESAAHPPNPRLTQR